MDLIEAIEANPDDPTGYAVYGDWLTERGDPLGELVGIHMSLEVEPNSMRRIGLPHKLRDKRDAYLAPYFPTWGRDQTVEFHWRHGFIHRIVAETNLGRELFDGIARCPAARFLRSLEAHIRRDRREDWEEDYGDPDDTTNPLPRLIEAGFPKTLRRLHLHLELEEAGADVPVDLSLLVPHFSRLEELSLRELSRTNLAVLSRASLPELETLRFLEWGELGDFDLRQAPRLRRLVLRRDADDVTTDEATWARHRASFASLAKSPVLRRVRTLDLETSVNADTFDAFLAALPAFEPLEEIRLSKIHLLGWQHDLLTSMLGSRLTTAK